MAQPRGRGVTQLALAAEFARVAEREGMGQSRGGERGGAGSLNAAALKEAVTAAVQEALSHLAPAPAQGENAAAVATAQQLNAAFAELRSMINNVASPAQGTVIVKKAKRFELGLSTSREKARPVLAPPCAAKAALDAARAPTQTCCPLARRRTICR